MKIVELPDDPNQPPPARPGIPRWWRREQDRKITVTLTGINSGFYWAAPQDLFPLYRQLWKNYYGSTRQRNLRGVCVAHHSPCPSCGGSLWEFPRVTKCRYRDHYAYCEKIPMCLIPS
jgi:hypothetical protein